MTRTNTLPDPTIGSSKALSLSQVREALAEDDAGKWDTICRRDELRMDEGRLTAPSPDGHRRLGLSTWASGQLCARLGIPVSYYRKCPAFLQDEQATYWLKNPRAAVASPDEEEGCSSGVDSCGTDAWGDGGRPRCRRPEAQACASAQPERWRLRAKDETLRAVVSDRYSPLDNTVLWEQMRRMVPARYKVDWFGLSDESLHLRLVDMERCREVLPGDDLTIGIHVVNSEVGNRALTVEALVYRLICTNGLIRREAGKSLLRQRHIHISALRLEAALAEATHRALEEAEAFLDLLKAATLMPIADMGAAIEQLGNRWNLPQSTQEAVKAALAREIPSQQETVYGAINAFTFVARSLPNDARYDLEVLAGHLAEQGMKGLKLPAARKAPLALPEVAR